MSSSPALSPEQAHARAAGLVYVSDTQPGVTRVVEGTGFGYALPSGEPVTDDEVLARIRALAVPPAWKDVWICLKESGHIQATGRDDRGRKQYRYHPDWRDVRDRDKFDHIVEFARRLPRIRARVERDLRRRHMSREKVLATVVSLLDKTLIRVGNDEYAKTNGSFGLTTLRNKHLKVAGNELRFHFKGKSGKVWRLAVKDRRIARVVASIQELPGQTLFQYIGDDGDVRSIDSSDVNDYLRLISGADISAKDFRTWSASVLAVLSFSAIGPFETKTQAKTFTRRAVETVAERLGNTPAICRKSYIHPAVITAYLDGTLPRVPIAGVTGEDELMRVAEAAVLKFLKRVSQPRRSRPRATKMVAAPAAA